MREVPLPLPSRTSRQVAIRVVGTDTHKLRLLYLLRLLRLLRYGAGNAGPCNRRACGLARCLCGGAWAKCLAACPVLLLHG